MGTVLLLRRAETDIKTAMLLYQDTSDEGNLDIAAFHTQQALEKALKHVLNGYIPVREQKVHDLFYLCDRIDTLGLQFKVPMVVRNVVAQVNRWESTTRYSGNYLRNRAEVGDAITIVYNFICYVYQQQSIGAF